MTGESADWWVAEVETAERRWRETPRWRVFRRRAAWDNWMSAVRLLEEQEMLRLASAKRAAAKRREYPYSDGDVLVLGPEIFVSSDGRVISWGGTNYVIQVEPPEEDEPDELGFVGYMAACARCGNLILASVEDKAPRCADEVACAARARDRSA